MLKIATMLVLLISACGDSALSSEMVDCNVKVPGAGAVTRCSPICAQYDSRLGPLNGSCTIARFAGSDVDSACDAFAVWLTDDNGDDHYGCCASGGWSDANEFFPNSNVPVGETHFLECDRSEWPKR